MTKAKFRAEWLPEQSLLLVKTLIKEKAEGHMVENGFKPVCWTTAATALQAELQVKLAESQIKAHWNRVCFYALHVLC